MHPERFFEAVEPEQVALHVHPAIAAAHYRYVGADRAGELVFGTYFAQG